MKNPLIMAAEMKQNIQAATRKIEELELRMQSANHLSQEAYDELTIKINNWKGLRKDMNKMLYGFQNYIL